MNVVHQSLFQATVHCIITFHTKRFWEQYMGKNTLQTCLKSGLPLANPAVCLMCKRACHRAGSRKRAYRQTTSEYRPSAH
ncbi:MAG: hypothetical protein CSA34_05220 [Desulfobulbus propionicus]|nr:MAG: hypothetical protein CSA34_05220 [Desulfobulbus propionicus]